MVERYAHQTNPSLFGAISTYSSDELLAGGGDAEPQTASGAGKFAKHSRYTVFNSQVFVAPLQLPSLGHTLFNILSSWIIDSSIGLTELHANVGKVRNTSIEVDLAPFFLVAETSIHETSLREASPPFTWLARPICVELLHKPCCYLLTGLYQVLSQSV